MDRTVGADKVVDEMDAFLPGVPPTGRVVRLPVVVVMGFDDGKLAVERVYWDQASALVQVGLLDGSKLPVTGAVQAEKVLDKELPANELVKRRG